MSATTTKLVYTFGDAEGADFTLSYNYADPETSAATIKATANTLIANKSIFQRQPTTLKAAKFVTTTTEDVDIS